MEKNDPQNHVSLLSEFYKEEECSTSSRTPPELEPQDERPRRKDLARITRLNLKGALGKVWAVVLAMFVSLIPSFVPKWGAQKNSKGQNGVEDRRLSPTAYLDGLRGIACFIVYLTHFVVNWFPALKNTYGASPTDNYFFQLPIIRLLFGGHPAVATFFVISGYAISYRALSKIHTGDTAGVLETLSSSTFRRCMRLYLPCAVNTFICMLLRYWDFFTPDPPRWNTLPQQFSTFSAQFWDWWANQKIFMYPLMNVEGPTYSPPYNGHLWTIPLEIRGSFVVYGTVLAVAKLSPGWRMAFLVAWDTYLFYMGKWDLFLFVGGALLANLDIPRHAKAKAIVEARKGEQPDGDEAEGLLPTTSEAMEMMNFDVDTSSRVSSSTWSKLTRQTKPYTTHIHKLTNPILRILRILIPYILFIISLLLLSFPHIPPSLGVLGPISTWVYALIPSSYNSLGPFFGDKDQGVRILGSLLLAFSLSLSAPPAKTQPDRQPRLPLRGRLFAAVRRMNLQSLFTNKFAQYLGRISFGFYLMHGPVLFCIGTKILVKAWAGYDANKDLGRYMQWFALAVVVNTVSIFVAADWFARVVDERSVRWAARVAKFVSRRKAMSKEREVR
ncbi:hypothetical protein ONS96_006917 [Cadophora gregata f. sp. sojae]|nr:hypothetical protein ONS96_006917 [Cadophora gregata f. sp. sojae]